MTNEDLKTVLECIHDARTIEKTLSQAVETLTKYIKNEQLIEAITKLVTETGGRQ